MGWMQTAGEFRHLLRSIPGVFWRMELRLRGIKFAPPLRLVGHPICGRYPGSSMIFGQSVILDSSPRGNPLGGAGPCVLRTVAKKAVLRLGDRVGISSSVIVAGNHIEIGANTLIGAGCMVIDNDFHVTDPVQGWRNECVQNSKPVRIGEGCFLGARSVILKGVQLGSGVVVGAGSVVTKSFSSGCVIGGNPAVLLRKPG